jgi:hypothetical protein
VFFFPLNSTNRGLGVAAGFLRDNYYREQKWTPHGWRNVIIIIIISYRRVPEVGTYPMSRYTYICVRLFLSFYLSICIYSRTYINARLSFVSIIKQRNVLWMCTERRMKWFLIFLFFLCYSQFRHNKGSEKNIWKPRERFVFSSRRSGRGQTL